VLFAWTHLRSEDHDLGGFDEGSRRLAFGETHLAGRVSGDYRSNVLASDGKLHLRQQSFDLEVDNSTDQLIPTADLTEVCTSLCGHVLSRGTIEMLVEFTFGNSMMATYRFYRTQLLGVNPALDGGITNSKNLRCFSGRDQPGVALWHSLSLEQRPSFGQI
jgi:hypothetical protein